MTDWRIPMKARAEELTEETDGVTDPRVRHAVLWHLDAKSYGRVVRMEACYKCLATFPARPSRATLKLWEEAERAGWRHVRPEAEAHRLICEEKCPVCASPINAVALRYNALGGNPLNERPLDE